MVPVRKKQLEWTREVVSAHELYGEAHKAFYFANQAKEEWEREHHCITGLLLTAFAFEALLNHWGKHLYADTWEIIERVALKKKLALICREIGLKYDIGAEPFQTIFRLARFRDRTA